MSTILDREPADQSGWRVFGDVDGQDVTIRYGNPDGSGLRLPNGQYELRVDVQKLKDLIIPAGAFGVPKDEPVNSGSGLTNG